MSAEHLPSAALDIVIHTLGLDDRRREPWRNHYITGADDALMAELVAAGLMEPVRRPGWLAAEDFPYRATEAGKIAAIAENEKRNPKPSRSRARYLHYLYRADAYGCSFGEYLRRGLYKSQA